MLFLTRLIRFRKIRAGAALFAATAAAVLLAACATTSTPVAEGPSSETGVVVARSPDASAVAIAVPAFAGESLMQGGSLAELVRKDLGTFGVFRIIDSGSRHAVEGGVPDYVVWRRQDARALLAGQVVAESGGLVEVRFRLYDIVQGKELFALKTSVRSQQMRAVAHHIAAVVHERMTGQRSLYETKIAYVEQRGARYQLMLADFDGENAIPVMISNDPIISLAWSPDGKALAYVGFDRKKPIVYIRKLSEPLHAVLANYKGSNSAPAWSPDGRRLALALTKDGPSQIYLINADGSGLRRLMNSPGIDTEPQFSPDGRQIYFTSDRGGNPQIYRISVDGGGGARRITFTGAYNVTPRVSPDGKTLVYISRNEGRFQLMSLDLASQQTQVLTDSAKNESPSFAPDGRTVLYVTEDGGRGALSVVSTDLRTRYRLSSRAGDVREPAWRPFEK